MRPRGRSDRAIFERLQAAEAVAARLRALTDSLGPDFISMRFYVRILVKGYDSVVKKIYMRRREKGKELYSLEDITDLVGFRIVTLYDDDIRTAIEHLFRLIRMGSSEPIRSEGVVDVPLFNPLYDESPTEWDVIREVIFFTRRPGSREDVYKVSYETLLRKLADRFGGDSNEFRRHKDKIRLRDVEEEIETEADDPEEADEEKETSDGYSSMHLILNAVSRIGTDSDGDPLLVQVPIEVQVRTAAEDIWGEINHQLSYKAKNLYVWTPELKKAYDRTRADSRFIKDSLDNLSFPITQFWRDAREAEAILGRFRSPTTTLHRSLIVALLYAMSDEFMGPVDQLLHQYDSLLVDLATARDDEHAANILLQCSRLVQEIDEKFEETIRETRHWWQRGDRSGLNQKLLRQRQMLCRLEIERLRALSVRRYNHMLTDAGKPQRIVSNRGEQLRKAFDAICEFRNAPKLLVRPVVMMSYWKYVLAGEIDKDLAMYHLRLAYDELDQDASLPRSSIYHTLVPRSLAAETRKEVVKLFAANGDRSSPEIWRRSQLAADIKFALTRALALALQAYNKAFGSGTGRDPRAGDLIYGHEKNENVHDADVITSILHFHLRLLGHPDYRALGTTKGFLIARATEARDFVRSNDTQDWAPNRLEAIETVLRQLNE
jgi:ppGpp synthetase/RelA/SpoT-type nucleotidyltranferase